MSGVGLCLQCGIALDLAVVGVTGPHHSPRCPLWAGVIDAVATTRQRLCVATDTHNGRDWTCERSEGHVGPHQCSAVDAFHEWANVAEVTAKPKVVPITSSPKSQSAQMWSPLQCLEDAVAYARSQAGGQLAAVHVLFVEESEDGGHQIHCSRSQMDVAEEHFYLEIAKMQNLERARS